MKKEYNFSSAPKNPYAKKLTKQIIINIDIDTIDYFKSQTESSGISYQTLISIYLADCATEKKNKNWLAIGNYDVVIFKYTQ